MRKLRTHGLEGPRVAPRRRRDRRGGDAVVLFHGKDGAPNAKATALLVAAGAKDASVAGAACVARFKHDLANPLAVSLGNETAPAFLAERCWLQRARGDTKPKVPSPFPADARKRVLRPMAAAPRAAELERRKAAPGNAPQDVKNTGGRVRWTNAKNDVHVAAQLPAGTKRGHCRVVIQATSLSIKVGEVDASGQFRLASLVDGVLFQEVDPTQSRWDFVEQTGHGHGRAPGHAEEEAGHALAHARAVGRICGDPFLDVDAFS